MADPATYLKFKAHCEQSRTQLVDLLSSLKKQGKRIMGYAAKHGFKLIEDCAQSTGGFYQGKRLGSMGDVGCFSFYPTKNLGAIGDGGAIVTQDSSIAHQVEILRQYGWEDRYISKIAGMNSRLDELQAAILRVKLPHLDSDNQKRVRIARAYDESLLNIAGGTSILAPHLKAAGEHVYHLYVVRSSRRDALQAFLKDRGIHTMIHYPMPIHLQPAYRNRIKTIGSLPETCKAVGEILSLPMYPELNDSQVKEVVTALRAFG